MDQEKQKYINENIIEKGYRRLIKLYCKNLINDNGKFTIFKIKRNGKCI